MPDQPIVKVFYADDDEDDRFVFKSAMGEINIPVELNCFSSGAMLETNLMAINYNLDLVFLDLNMPGRSGLETLDSLQTPILRHKLKVVIFSTAADRHVVQETHLRNAVLFVQKPLDFKLLVRTLQEVIKIRNKLQNPVSIKDFLFNLSDVPTLYDC